MTILYYSLVKLIIVYKHKFYILQKSNENKYREFQLIY